MVVRWKQIGPIVLIIRDEKTQTLLDISIDNLDFIINLQISRNIQLYLDTYNFTKFFLEFRDELKIAIVDDILKKVEDTLNIIVIQHNCFYCTVRLETRKKIDDLDKTIDYYKDVIVAFLVFRYRFKIYRDIRSIR